VGSFIGHIVSAVKADVRKPPGQMAVRSVPQPVSRPDHVATAERLEQDASGRWVLRRITIETVGLPGTPPASVRPANPLPPIDHRQLPLTTR